MANVDIENPMVVDAYWPDEEREEYADCEYCRNTIFYGDYFYHMDGAFICEDCIERHMRKHYMIVAEHD